MPEVIVFAEGTTEEYFIKQVVAPALRGMKIYLKPILLNTSSQARGGAISFDRFLFNSRNALRRNTEIVLSSFLDLYGLDTDFPGFESSKKMINVHERVHFLEAALHRAVIEHVGCRSERFLPHIQPYEYEGLLFSDVIALAGTEPSWKNYLISLQKIRSEFSSPEHINNSYETKPSKRLENLLHPKYKKTIHGPRAAKQISLEVMELECVHFRNWMNNLRKLAQADE